MLGETVPPQESSKPASMAVHLFAAARCLALAVGLSITLGLAATPVSAAPVEPATAKSAPSAAQIQDIIQKFTAKETEFAEAREGYTYQQNSKLEETDPAGGSYEVVENVGFDDRDRRTSRVIHAPVTSLQNIQMTNEDEQDLANVMPFVFTTSDANEYDVQYVGREQVDEISCYVFSVHPKNVSKENRKRRYFEGQVWVDDQDLLIVKTFGKGIGYIGRNNDQQFPRFTTYREQIDGHYWFPPYTYADDVLHFKGGTDQRIKVIVKYSNYKKYQFKTHSTITFGEVTDAPKPPATAAPAPH